MTEPSAVVIPTGADTKRFDMKVFADAKRPISLYDLDAATLRAIHAAIEDTVLELHGSHTAPVIEFRNLCWVHGNTPPLNELHEEGWHLVGWPHPVSGHVDGHVRWYATMQRKVGTEAG